LTAALCALPCVVGPLFACSSTPELEDEGWRAGGKADENGVTLRYKSYDVMFTNPLCREYTYASPVPSADGSTTLTAKPKNVYCSYDDMAASAARPESPQHKLLSWLEPLDAGDEVFLAFLSFSNVAVADALCAAAE